MGLFIRVIKIAITLPPSDNFYDKLSDKRKRSVLFATQSCIWADYFRFGPGSGLFPEPETSQIGPDPQKSFKAQTRPKS